MTLEPTDSELAIGADSTPAGGASRSVGDIRRGFHIDAARLVFILGDLVTALLCAAVAILVRREVLPVFSGIDAFAPVRDYLSLWPALVLLILGRAAVGLYPGFGLHPAEELRRQSWVTLGLSVAVLAGGALFSFSADYSRVVLVLTAVMLLVALPVARSAVRVLLITAGRFGAPVWVLGNSDKAQRLTELMTKHPELGLRPMGMGPNIPGPELRCRHCLVVPDGLDNQPIADLLDKINDRFERVWLVPDLLDVASVWVTPRDIQGHLALELRNNLLERGNQVTKRALDLGLCTLGLPLAALLGLLVAGAVRASGRGPVILRQTRVGVGGKQFDMLKFRTMYVDAGERLEALLASDPASLDEWQRTRKLTSDPRVTRVGRILRRTSFDELPQLLNVLAGSMSLVGPRPVMADEVDWYGDNAALLHKVKPGMTGLTQISGRSTLDYTDRVRLDTYYVRNWSVWLDIVVLARTIGSVVRGTGAF